MPKTIVPDIVPVSHKYMPTLKPGYAAVPYITPCPKNGVPGIYDTYLTVVRLPKILGTPQNLTAGHQSQSTALVLQCSMYCCDDLDLPANAIVSSIKLVPSVSRHYYS